MVRRKNLCGAARGFKQLKLARKPAIEQNRHSSRIYYANQDEQRIWTNPRRLVCCMVFLLHKYMALANHGSGASNHKVLFIFIAFSLYQSLGITNMNRHVSKHAQARLNQTIALPAQLTSNAAIADSDGSGLSSLLFLQSFAFLVQRNLLGRTSSPFDAVRMTHSQLFKHHGVAPLETEPFCGFQIDICLCSSADPRGG
jgi:hypothetical protein